MQMNTISDTGPASASEASLTQLNSAAGPSSGITADEYVGRHRPHQMNLLHPRGRGIEHDGAA